MIIYKIFNYRGTQYRAKIENGTLIALCLRRGPAYPWQRVSRVLISDIWIPYINEVRARQATPSMQAAVQ